jgi:hypothetical protein
MLRPHGRQRQSDDYSNGDFEETVKRDNPRGVRTGRGRGGLGEHFRRQNVRATAR